MTRVFDRFAVSNGDGLRVSGEPPSTRLGTLEQMHAGFEQSSLQSGVGFPRLCGCPYRRPRSGPPRRSRMYPVATWRISSQASNGSTHSADSAT
jgi:hypothetical protein